MQRQLSTFIHYSPCHLVAAHSIPLPGWCSPHGSALCCKRSHFSSPALKTTIQRNHRRLVLLECFCSAFVHPSFPWCEEVTRRKRHLQKMEWNRSISWLRMSLPTELTIKDRKTERNHLCKDLHLYLEQHNSIHNKNTRGKPELHICQSKVYSSMNDDSILIQSCALRSQRRLLERNVIKKWWHTS